MISDEVVVGKKEALRVAEFARILYVSFKEICRATGKAQIPSLGVFLLIGFDTHKIATWLRILSPTDPALAVLLPNRWKFEKMIDKPNLGDTCGGVL